MRVSPYLWFSPTPAPVALSKTCSATVAFYDLYDCSLTVIGSGSFTGSYQTDHNLDWHWRTGLPAGVICIRTTGQGDGSITCDVPEGVSGEISLGGQILGGSVNVILAVSFSPGAPTTPLVFAETCGATVSFPQLYTCAVTVIGPGRFLGSYQTDHNLDWQWRIGVPNGVTCTRTSGHGDGSITCDVPEGVSGEVSLGGQSLSGSVGVTLNVNFSQGVPPAPLVFAETCGATLLFSWIYNCAVTVVGPGTFIGSLQTGGNLDFQWSVWVPTGVTCTASSGAGDGAVTCAVPTGVSGEAIIWVQNVGSSLGPPGVTINMEFAK